jgi:hypothetical protein
MVPSRCRWARRTTSSCSRPRASTCASDAQGLGAALSLPLEGLGGIDADLSLPGFVLDSGPAQPLRGRVQLRLDGLSRISNLLPDIDDVNGNIDADLALGGTLGQPDIRTDLRVQDLGLSVPLFGFELSETNLTATSAGPSALTAGRRRPHRRRRVRHRTATSISPAMPQPRSF